jgi:hypothetical protein
MVWLLGLAAGSVLVLTIAGAITAGQLGSAARTAEVAAAVRSGSPTSTSAASSAPAAPLAQPITRKRLQHAGVLAEATSEPPAVSYGDAVAAAVSSAGRSQGTPVAELYRVTTLHMGRELERDPSAPSRIKPEFENLLTWVVTFPLRQVSAHNPDLSQENTDDLPDGLPGMSTSVTFIDASTGDWMFALDL